MTVTVTSADGRRLLRRVVRILDDAYGRPVLTPRYPPVDELVYTVLSQNTADVNTDRTFAALKARFPRWTEVRDAPEATIEQTIALGGLAHTKAPRIKAILAAVSERTGEPDLSELDGMTDAEAQAHLTRLPGIGPKTAADLLQAPAIVVTNVRLGLQAVHWYEGRRLALPGSLTRLWEAIDAAAF